MVASVNLGTRGVTRDEVVAVARHDARVKLADDALDALAKGRMVVETATAGPGPLYGVSTGFGALAGERIADSSYAEAQHALLRSHAAGLGPLVEPEVVRALAFLRLRTLASGRTGVRPVVAQTLAAVLNAGITPAVREFGSLGCSGDLAPLAHVALALIGEGEVLDEYGLETAAAEALRAHGIAPLALGAKEGLALINGTDGMLGMLILALDDMTRLAKTADIVTAMSLEALGGLKEPFLPEIHALRPHPGQAAAAANVLRLLEKSEVLAHRAEFVAGRIVQDAYSLRCSPQVAGAARDTIEHAVSVAERELASIIDNPVVVFDGRGLVTNGNFHGAPVAFALDFLAIAAAELGSIAERRTDRMLDSARSAGLPPFLALHPGVDSGLMIAHYTQAALVAENKRLAVPAGTDSIPTSAMQEDHVSMGWSAARKLRAAIDNLGKILAIELVVAARALELRQPWVSAPATAAVVKVLRQRGVPGFGKDRYLSTELRKADQLVRTGVVLSAAEAEVGSLH